MPSLTCSLIYNSNFFIVDDGNYKISPTKCKLQHYYSRNPFKISKKFISVSDVSDIHLSLGEVNGVFYNQGGQGYITGTIVSKNGTYGDANVKPLKFYAIPNVIIATRVNIDEYLNIIIYLLLLLILYKKLSILYICFHFALQLQ